MLFEMLSLILTMFMLMLKKSIHFICQCYTGLRRLFQNLKKIAINEGYSHAACSKQIKSTISPTFAKLVLENWFENNLCNPYALASDIKQLSAITKIEEREIRLWLKNKRRLKNHKEMNTYRTKRVKFSNEEKLLLNEYYEKTTNHPGPQDLEYLRNSINKDKDKIRAWFTQKRYKAKNM